MNQTLSIGRVVRAAIFVLAGIVGLCLAREIPTTAVTADDRPAPQANTPTNAATDSEGRLPLAEAKERAKWLHDIYATTLDVMHDRYFHANRAIVPARAMEDVFAEMDRLSKVKARWIAVNTRAMGLNHEPQSEFEKQAATELSSGKKEFEAVEDGYYRRVGIIPFKAGCVDCHLGFVGAPPKTPRFAGLVISIPVKAAP